MANQQQQQQQAHQSGQTSSISSGKNGFGNQTNGSPGNATSQHDSSKMNNNSNTTKGELSIKDMTSHMSYHHSARVNSNKSLSLEIHNLSKVLN